MAIRNLFGGGKKSALANDMLDAFSSSSVFTGVDNSTVSSDTVRRYYQSMVDAQKNQFVGVATNTVAASDTYYTPEAIAFRLRMSRRELEAKGIEILNVRRVVDEVHVVLGVKDQTLVLKDDEGSFPSDEFVAKLRLLL